MSVFADRKRQNLAQVSADSAALTRKRIEEDFATLGVSAPSKVGPSSSDDKPTPAARKEEAEQRAETVVKDEKGAK